LRKILVQAHLFAQFDGKNSPLPSPQKSKNVTLCKSDQIINFLLLLLESEPRLCLCTMNRANYKYENNEAKKYFCQIWPGLNYINVLRAAFMCADPRSVKKTVKSSIFFTLLGSTSVKADH